jgi:hypothetical protein
MWAAYREVARIWEYLKDRNCSCQYLEAPESNQDLPIFEQKSNEDQLISHLDSFEGEDKSNETNYQEAADKTNKTQPQELRGPQLPPEMLDRVFLLLSPQDLKSVVQVCRLWREVGERPGLWTWGVARATGQDMAEVLASRRMLMVTGLRLEGGLAVSGDLLEALTRLERLEVTGAVLSSQSPGLLAGAVAGLQEVQLSQAAVCSHQAEEVFTAVTVETRLRKLSICQTVLTTVSPGLLAGAAAQLVELSLPASQLTGRQAAAILAVIGQQTRLKKLDLSDNKYLFWDIAPSLLAGAVELEEFRIRATNLGLHKMSILLAAIGPYTKLRKLDLDWNYELRYVEPGLLGGAVTWLEELSISHVRIHKPQVQELFTAIARPTRLKTLKIGNIGVPIFFSWALESAAFAKKMKLMKENLEVVKGKRVLDIVPLSTLYLALILEHFTINIEANRLTMN